MEIAYEGRRYSLSVPSDDDHIAKSIERTGSFYELDLLEYIRSIRPWMTGDTAVDVGANIGNHSLYFGQFLCESVYSFEPNPLLFQLLGPNLSGRCALHHCVPMAAGSAAGPGELLQGPAWNSGMGRAVAGSGNIRFTTLDALVAKCAVALIKIDVEGGELDVLRGGVKTLASSKPHLFIECATPDALNEISDFLQPLGYSPLGHWAVTPVYHFAHQPPLSLRMFARFARARYVAGRAVANFLGRA